MDPGALDTAVEAVNGRQRERFISRIVDFYEGRISGKQFALWGLAFKPNTDDVREAPAHTIIRALLEGNAAVAVYDPEGRKNTQRVFGDAIAYARDLYSALHDAEALIIATEWNEFRNPDFNFIGKTLAQPVIFDGRNLYDPERLAEMGFEYFSVGRPSFAPRRHAEKTRVVESGHVAA